MGGHLNCEISGDELTFFTCAFDQKTDQNDEADAADNEDADKVAKVDEAAPEDEDDGH